MCVSSDVGAARGSLRGSSGPWTSPGVHSRACPTSLLSFDPLHYCYDPFVLGLLCGLHICAGDSARASLRQPRYGPRRPINVRCAVMYPPYAASACTLRGMSRGGERGRHVRNRCKIEREADRLSLTCALRRCAMTVSTAGSRRCVPAGTKCGMERS